MVNEGLIAYDEMYSGDILITIVADILMMILTGMYRKWLCC